MLVIDDLDDSTLERAGALVAWTVAPSVAASNTSAADAANLKRRALEKPQTATP